MKNKYHPLLKQKYFLGILSEYEMSLVKPRTFYSWAHINQEELTGFNSSDPLITDKSVFAFAYTHGHVRKLLKVYMALFSCFRHILKSIKRLNGKLRLNKAAIIKAYQQCRRLIKSSKFERLTGISVKKISRWLNEVQCEKSFLSTCKVKNPAQLTFKEQIILTEALNDEANAHLFICDVWAKLARTGKLNCKLSTFYKYSRIAIKKLGLRKRKFKRALHSILAKKPLTVLHMDCTVIRSDDGGKWHLNIVYDNFSKAILGIKAMLNPNSFEVAENLQAVIKEFNLQGKRLFLYCDGGPENKKHVDALLDNYPKIKKLVTSFSNGIHNNMIESYNSKFKRKHMLFLDLSKHENIPGQLDNLKAAFNNMPQALIGTLSPNEVLSGLKPWKNIWPQIENNIKSAKIERIKTNLMTCCITPE